MDIQQEEQLEYLQTKIGILVDQKYRRGAKEHTDKLSDKTPLELIEDAVDEAVDQLVYLLVARKKLKNIKEKYGQHEASNVGMGNLPRVDTNRIP